MKIKRSLKWVMSMGILVVIFAMCHTPESAIDLNWLEQYNVVWTTHSGRN